MLVDSCDEGGRKGFRGLGPNIFNFDALLTIEACATVTMYNRYRLLTGTFERLPYSVYLKTSCTHGEKRCVHIDLGAM